jgi:hypothetical protein
MKDAFVYIEDCPEKEKCESGTYWKRKDGYGKEELVVDKAPFDGFCPVYQSIFKTLRENGYFWIQGFPIPKANENILVRVFGNDNENKMAVLKMYRDKRRCEHDVLLTGENEEKLITEIKNAMNTAKKDLLKRF